MILTPTGKDGDLVCGFLNQAGLGSLACQSLDELTGHIEQERGPAVIAEEALGDDAQTQRFLKALATQPAWSDVPLLIIRSRHSSSPYLEKLTTYFNCMIQNRPIHLPAFVTSVQSAVQARRRQLEIKKTTELLSQARRYAESIIETIEEAVLVVDADLRIVSANKPFYRIFQKQQPQVIGRYVYDLVNGHWRDPEFRTVIESILSERRNVENYEIRYPRKKGSLHLLLNAKPISGSGNNPAYILLAFQDITIHRLQEEALKNLTEQLLMAEEKQRQQMAVALHDSIGQLLAFSKREITTLLQEPAFEGHEQLLKISDLLTECIRQSRKLTTDLSSPTLHMFGLQAGIEELAEQFADEQHLACSFRPMEKPLPLEKRIELLLYRSVKELLCNIAKHADADHVEIAVAAEDGTLRLTVADDGKGFDPAAATGSDGEHAFGLRSIQQRLTNLKGSLNIISEPDKGTTVTLQAPLKLTL